MQYKFRNEVRNMGKNILIGGAWPYANGSLHIGHIAGLLLGGYGNFVNRSLAFIEKYLDGTVPEGKADPEIHRQIGELYTSVGRLIEKGSFKDALERIFDFVRSANKFFDARQP